MEKVLLTISCLLLPIEMKSYTVGHRFNSQKTPWYLCSDKTNVLQRLEPTVVITYMLCNLKIILKNYLNLTKVETKTLRIYFAHIVMFIKHNYVNIKK